MGQYIYKIKSAKKKKGLLWISIIFNIGLLGFFKYFNFFIDSFIETFSFFGVSMTHVWTLNIILPVGISFYTFQTMSYSLDIFKGKMTPTKDFVSFATFVSFFPQLVAGPIERASNLLPQILDKRKFTQNQATQGVKLILWGLFKKVAIADALAPMVDDIFSNAASYPSSTLLLGAVFFGFQIYGDFSGYSDIAIGTAKLFGIELMSNFKFPYFSRNIAEFWRRWHISLSTWFRDYLYIPLGGSRTKRSLAIRNVFVIFLVSGFWHGANWTFIAWGGLHALLFVPVFLTKNNRNYVNTTIGQTGNLPTLKEITQVIATFLAVSITWVFFRAESLSLALDYVKAIFLELSFESYSHPLGYRMIDYFILLLIFVVFEYGIRRDERNPFPFKSKLVRFCAYTLVVFTLLLFFDSGIDRSFIYFQF
ncbi:MBOAT family O-acyltransferase [Flagellimonas sp. 2504JD1-5]